jgi:8-oxo-dGTP pyrophosphatase MutT (NUDIX family)
MPDAALDRLRRAIPSVEPGPFDEASLEADFPGTRKGAVLALFYPRDGEPHIVLTQRTTHLSSHSGQISFPGGRIDPHDYSAAEAALRETREEVGIATDGIDLHGPLDPVHTVVSNYILIPYVGFAAHTPAFVPNPYEVEHVIELPFRHLLNPATPTDEVWPLRGDRRRVGFYRYGPHKIWGATARVLRQIVALAGGPELPSGLVPPGEVEPVGRVEGGG